jgi:hypothetical protein
MIARLNDPLAHRAERGTLGEGEYMNTLTRSIAGFGLLAGIVVAANGHVRLISPNNGEILTANGTWEIQWEIAIAHNLENWDLSYNTDLGNADWITIMDDVVAGDPSQGSIHTFTWTVPDILDDSVWVRVIMDNDTTDYLDISNQPFSIVPAPGSLVMVFASSFACMRRRRV